MISFREFKHYCGNYILVFYVVFKNALAVSKMAFFFGKGSYFLIFDCHCFAGNEGVFDFRTISSNVLNWRSSYISRDKGHVFQSAKILIDGPKHKFMPVFTRLTFHPNKIIIFLFDFFTFQINVNHQCFNIFCQKHVASSSQNKFFLGFVLF